jgi:hypothetical protein
MRTRFLRSTLLATATFASLAVAAAGASYAQQPDASAPAQPANAGMALKIGPSDIGGVVTSSKGPEAGVWVIAETSDLPTRFIKIVVTDDQGRYLLPDLPEANYQVWARGYGLVDSPKIHGVPGKRLDLTGVLAPTAAAAAHYYPAIYWYSLMPIPSKSQFGGKTDIPAGVTQQQWLTDFKNQQCVGCHQQGQESTRTFPAAFSHFSSSEEAWMRRTQSGQAGAIMVDTLAGKLGGSPYQYLAAYTDAIARGELPKSQPPRPQGLERDVVVTLWGWGTDHTYLHDGISTDKRYPTVNAYGPIIGSTEYSTDKLPVLDPKTNTATYYEPPIPAGMPEMLGPGNAAMAKPLLPSAYWGDRKIWDAHLNNHNSMYDEKGRLWLTVAGRGNNDPAWCGKGSDLVSAKLFPLKAAHRELAMYDRKANKFTYIDTCFETQHLQFGFDKEDTLWTSGGGPVIGWLDVKKYLATGDAEHSQGWAALSQDTKDPSVKGSGTYAIMPSPVDNSVWATVNVFAGAGGIVRLDPGANPPQTARIEFFKIPSPGFGPRGGDIDSQGVVWVSLASGHLGSFDRRKCKGPLDNGPGPGGVLCPEGWSFYQYPGPGFAGIGKNSAEASYYTWVDQHDTLGLGKDVVISTGNENDALLAFDKGKWVIMRVPYPMSFYAKGLDGRIDDPNGGWTARGVWTTSGDRTPWLKEGGKGTTPLAMHFQIRPNPLAD